MVTKWTTLWLSQAFRGGREKKAASLKKSEVGLQKNETGEPGRSGPELEIRTWDAKKENGDPGMPWTKWTTL